MRESLGFDTSNYTTSVAIASENDYRHNRQILDVKEGERGLRQSNALFLHTKNLSDVFSKLDISKKDIICVASSDKPRDEEGSYMPCFLCGTNASYIASKTLGVPNYNFSHQAGHIMAICKTCDDDSLVNKEFISYHISGGTTEIVHCIPDKDRGFKVKVIGGTKDISIGQLIDRCGVKLGYKFPCGGELEKDLNSILKMVKTKIDDGFYNLSGIENKYDEYIKDGKSKNEIISYLFSICASYIIDSSNSILAREEYKNLPIVYAGGVMKNEKIRQLILNNVSGATMGSIELSSDNAVGIAWLGLYKEEGRLG